MAKRVGWAVIGLLFGCRDPEERFLVEGVDALCAAAAECAGTYPAQTCVDALRTAALDCTFDRDQADACQDALDGDLECREHPPYTLTALVVPEPCAAAYTCGKNSGWTDPLGAGLPTTPGG